MPRAEIERATEGEATHAQLPARRSPPARERGPLGRVRRLRSASACAVGCIALLVACSSVRPGAPPAPAASGFSDAALARLDRALDAFVDGGRLPGYQLMITRRGRLAHQRVYGSMDVEAGRALREDTIYRIYSMSKVITGAATMIAWEQGLFLLTDPVAKHLPELAELEVMVWDEDGDTRTVPAERPITVLDLLRHTSGLTYHFLAPDPIGALYREHSISPGGQPLARPSALGNGIEDRTLTLQAFVGRLPRVPLIAQPGTAWNYSISMDVLGALIERTSGQPYAEFLDEHLFTPLGMDDTGFHVPDDRADRLAACYGPTAGGGMALLDPPAESLYRQAPALPSGGGGMVSTAADYTRFARMLLNGGVLDGRRVLGRRTVELMMSDHLPEEVFGPTPLAAMARETYANGGIGLRFGLTGSVVTDGASTSLPVSEGTFGWGGAASTFFWVDPVERVTVVFMTQLIPSSTYPIRPILMRGVNAALVD